MSRERVSFMFLNIGHLLDHLFLLIFATVAALALTTDWNMSYGKLVFFATSGAIALGACTIPAGWIADKWSREGMMVIFFIGIGSSSILTSFAENPIQISGGLFLIGMFAAIYHPVGLALVVQGLEKTGVPLAVNGIWGNVGVGAAALVTGFLIDVSGWRTAFIVPGVISILTGIAYLYFVRGGASSTDAAKSKPGKPSRADGQAALDRPTMIRIFAVILFSTAVGGLVFQSTTFAMPKIFDERLTEIAGTATLVGVFAFIVFCVAAFAQVLVGLLADRFAIRWVFTGVAATQVVFLALMQGLNGVAALIVAIVAMMAVFGQIPINDILVGRISTTEWRSRVYAFRYVVTFTAAALTLPFVGWLHGRWGFTVLFIVLAVAAAVMLAAILTLPTTHVTDNLEPSTAAAE